MGIDKLITIKNFIKCKLFICLNARYNVQIKMVQFGIMSIDKY